VITFGYVALGQEPTQPEHRPVAKRGSQRGPIDVWQEQGQQGEAKAKICPEYWKRCGKRFQSNE
jgi:hypothetical protein